MFPKKQLINEINKIVEFDVYVDNRQFAVKNKKLYEGQSVLASEPYEIARILEEIAQADDACFITFNEKKVLL